MSSDRTELPGEFDPQRFAAWYREFSERLRAFLFGLLRDHHAAEEALQATFVKAVSKGGNVQAGSEKPWLFQVAFNEAMALRRRWELEQRSLNSIRLESEFSPGADFELLRWETVQQVRQAIEQLPAEQQQVVLARMYEEKTFQQIADEQQLPLGTVLTRMRLALQKLAKAIQDHTDL